MAEQVSRQAAKVAANQKMAPNEAYGKKRAVVITSPAAVTWANGDTIASPVVLPAGTRIALGSRVSCAAMGASVVLAVGLRNAQTGVAIDAAGIATGVSVASAGQYDLANGTFTAAGAEYVTTVPTQVFATLSGATPTANAQIRIEVEIITAD